MAELYSINSQSRGSARCPIWASTQAKSIDPPTVSIGWSECEAVCQISLKVASSGSSALTPDTGMVIDSLIGGTEERLDRRRIRSIIYRNNSIISSVGVVKWACIDIPEPPSATMIT